MTRDDAVLALRIHQDIRAAGGGVGPLEDTGDIFSAEAAMNLYRIVQESLNNILKHSHAQTVRVRLERDIHEVVLEIADDGCGFVPGAETNGKPGMGLKNITERVRMLGGRLSIDSAPATGTRITVTVPVPDGEEPSGS